MKESSKTPAKNPAQKPAPRLSRVIDTLKKKGASEVRVIKAADVIVDERVRLKCQVPICDSYGKNLMCPPYLPSVADFRDALARYDRALIVQLSVPLHRKAKGGRGLSSTPRGYFMNSSTLARGSASRPATASPRVSSGAAAGSARPASLWNPRATAVIPSGPGHPWRPWASTSSARSKRQSCPCCASPYRTR
ncbi:MAG: hypothetical protein IPI61_11840 [Syntrophaceae bacterium]|nr:hypothetical protein [Syntrophaceae bacterium]